MRTIQTAEVFNAIYQRRAIRRYAETEVERSTIAELVDAAVQAPSATNEQPWAFAVIYGSQRLRALSQRIKDSLSPYAQTESENLFHGAPALLVICATSPRRQAAEDCALAAQNFMLAAFASGLGTCPIGLARAWLGRPEIKSELGVPPELTPVVPLAVGYPQEHPDSPGRRPARIIEL